MSKKDAKLTYVMIVNDYNKSHYKWDDKELLALCHPKDTAEVILARLESHNISIAECYIIEHKPEKKQDDYDNIHEHIHYHLVIKFKNTDNTTLNYIAQSTGISENQIGIGKPGRYSYENALSYLTHIKYKNKIQYKSSDVYTIRGKDYNTIYNEHKESWIKARARMSESSKENNLEQTFKKVDKALRNFTLFYEDICNYDEYRPLLLEDRYRKKLKNLKEGVRELADLDYNYIEKKIILHEITSYEEILEEDKYKAAVYYHSKDILFYLKHNM